MNDNRNNSKYDINFYDYQLRKIIHKISQKILPKKQFYKNGKIIFNNNLKLKELSKQQKNLRIKITNSKNHDCAKKIRKKRNKILSDIKKELKLSHNKWINYMVNEIEKNKNNNKFYKAIEKLNYKKHNKFYLHDDDGKLFINDNQLVIMTTEYYKKLFSDQNILRKNKN